MAAHHHVLVLLCEGEGGRERGREGVREEREGGTGRDGWGEKGEERGARE